MAGYGSVGNDLLGVGVPYFATDILATQDVERAKSLLKAAGSAGATFTLQTSPVAPGVLEAATLYAQQAAAAGITINLNQVSPADYYTPAGGYGLGPFRQDTYVPAGSLATYYFEFFSRNASLNETNWGHQPGGAASWSQIDEAIATTNPSRAQDLWHAVQEQQFTQGGLLIWGNAYSLNLISKSVKGLTEAPVGNLNNGRFVDAWVA
jgi:peptide/nickel transport system substrate-binding protein